MSLMEYLQNPGSNPALRQGLLQFGMSLLGQPGGNLLGSISRAGLAGLGGYQAADEQMRQRSMQDQQLEFQKAQQEAWKKAQEQAAQQEALQAQAVKGAYTPGQSTGANPYALDYENSMDSGGAVNMRPGQFDMRKYAEQLAAAGSPMAIQAFNALKKEEKPLIPLSEGASLFDQNTGRIVASNPKPEKPLDLPSAVREYQFAQSQGYKGSFQQWDMDRKRAGAPSVNVSTGQKGYDNESKLRNDFKSEPIYKDYQDMASAYKQIKAGIAQGTPISDVAVATKMMKLLDPGSVVRESELGIAMAASGKMDRLSNYIDMWKKGNLLTPQQRQDFGTLADELMQAAGQAYNAKRAEYETMGKRYGLDASVLGGAYVPPQPTKATAPTTAPNVQSLVDKYRSPAN